MLLWNSSPFCLELYFQLSQLTRPPHPWRKAAASAYRSRSQTSSGSRRSSRALAWRRGWCWWASAAGCTVDTAGGSSWDTTPRPSRTRQQVSGTGFDVAVVSGVLSIMAGVQRINCKISRIPLNFWNVTFSRDFSTFFCQADYSLENETGPMTWLYDTFRRTLSNFLIMFIKLLKEKKLQLLHCKPSDLVFDKRQWQKFMTERSSCRSDECFSVVSF